MAIRIDARLAALAQAVQRQALNASRTGADHMDAGPAILSSLVLCPERSVEGPELMAATLAWLDAFEPPPAGLALFGGVGGLYAGSVVLERTDARFASLARSLRESVTRGAAASGWRFPARDWEDYDLVSGAAGTVLAMCLDAQLDPRELLPSVRHLVNLCDAGTLAHLRIDLCRGDALRGWNYHRVNTGVAHGVGGIAAALTAAHDRLGESTGVRSTLGAVIEWLMADAYTDSLGLTTWLPHGRDGAPPPDGWSRRQAWCYGTPGLAWAIWNAGRTLGDKDLQAFAVAAMSTYCEAFDEARYFDREVADALAICHGAAGVLLIADAFARHAQHEPAAALSERVAAWLFERGEQIIQLARSDQTLLSGASGIVSALIARSGGDRRWLPVLGLN